MAIHNRIGHIVFLDMVHTDISDDDIKVREFYAVSFHMCALYIILDEPYTEYHLGLCVECMVFTVGIDYFNSDSNYVHIHRKTLKHLYLK